MRYTISSNGHHFQYIRWRQTALGNCMVTTRSSNTSNRGEVIDGSIHSHLHLCPMYSLVLPTPVSWMAMYYLHSCVSPMSKKKQFFIKILGRKLSSKSIPSVPICMVILLRVFNHRIMPVHIPNQNNFFRLMQKGEIEASLNFFKWYDATVKLKVWQIYHKIQNWVWQDCYSLVNLENWRNSLNFNLPIS